MIYVYIYISTSNYSCFLSKTKAASQQMDFIPFIFSVGFRWHETVIKNRQVLEDSETRFRASGTGMWVVLMEWGDSWKYSYQRTPMGNPPQKEPYVYIYRSI